MLQRLSHYRLFPAPYSWRRCSPCPADATAAVLAATRALSTLRDSHTSAHLTSPISPFHSATPSKTSRCHIQTPAFPVDRISSPGALHPPRPEPGVTPPADLSGSQPACKAVSAFCREIGWSKTLYLSANGSVVKWPKPSLVTVPCTPTET